jgi:hypothetical protein
MTRIPAHLRGPALTAAGLVVALALVALATAARAQAEGLPPVADPGLGALAPLLDGAGSAGLFAVAVIGIVRDWRREWREESSRHAGERERSKPAVVRAERSAHKRFVDGGARPSRALVGQALRIGPSTWRGFRCDRPSF